MGSLLEMEKEHELLSLYLQTVPTLRFMALSENFPQIRSSSSLLWQWGRAVAHLQERAPSPVLMGSFASGPGKVILEMRSQSVHQELSTVVFFLPLQSCHARRGCSSFHRVFKTTSSSQQTSIQHQEAKGQKAAAAKEMSHRRTAASPALLSSCSQLTLT